MLILAIKLIIVVFLIVQCPHDQAKKESSKNIGYFLRYGRFSKCSFWSKASPFFLTPQQFSLYDICSMGLGCQQISNSGSPDTPEGSWRQNYTFHIFKYISIQSTDSNYDTTVHYNIYDVALSYT